MMFQLVLPGHDMTRHVQLSYLNLASVDPGQMHETALRSADRHLLSNL